MKRYRSTLPACYTVILLILFQGCTAQSESSLIGSKAPSFTLTSLDGEPTNLEALRGSPVVIHFGTSWCPFCRAEDPYLLELAQSYRGQNVQVLVINVKESDEKALEWYEEAGFDFPMLMDRDGSVAARYAPQSAQPDLPRDEVMIASNLIIDGAGNIRFFSLLDTNAFDARLIALQKQLDQILAERTN